MAEEDGDEKPWHWRDTMRPARFFNMDGRSAIPFCILLVYFRPVTIVLTILTTLIFRLLEKKGLTFPAALRALRVWMIGINRPGLSSVFRYKFDDYG